MTLTATASGTVAGSAPGLYPNKPTGVSTLYEWSCGGLWSDTNGVAQTTGNGIISGNFWRYPSTAIATTDATAVQSPPGVVSYTWPVGLKDGDSSGLWFLCWKDSVSTEVSTLYESIRIRIPQSNIQFPGSGGTKIFGLWGCGLKGAADNQVVGWLTGGGLITNGEVWIKQQNVVTRNMTQNLDGTHYFTIGPWHQLEFLYRLNTIGSANGSCDVWIDGHHVMRWTDVTWRNAANPSGFFKRKWDPVWGGNGADLKTQADKITLDHIYAAGA